MDIRYAMVFVSDMRQATAFYKDVLGLPSRFESPGWTEFATEGCTLALHATDTPAPETSRLGIRRRMQDRIAGPDGMVFSVGESRAG